MPPGLNNKGRPLGLNGKPLKIKIPGEGKIFTTTNTTPEGKFVTPAPTLVLPTGTRKRKRSTSNNFIPNSIAGLSTEGSLPSQLSWTGHKFGNFSENNRNTLRSNKNNKTKKSRKSRRRNR